MSSFLHNTRSLLHKVYVNIWLYSVKLFLVAVSIICMPFVLLIARILPDQSRVKFGLFLIWIYGRFWYRAISLVIKFKVLGEEKLSSPPYVFVANHESMLDMYCFGAQKIWAMSVVVRGWPFRLPFLAPFMRMSGYLDADQDPFTFLSQARTLLHWGVSLLFFPEGTRKKQEILNCFKSGAFKVALQTGIPVVPICIKGTGQLLAPGKKVFSTNDISMEFLDPIDPAWFKEEKRPAKAMAIYIRSKMHASLT